MKVSVCVPVYNVELYIRRCIESIQKQTIKDIEIIVVDDASSDNSINIVEEMAQNDNRIKIIHHEKNMGLMWARRTGYMAAIGDYITFCDSDDYLPIDSIEILLSEAEKTQADVVSGDNIYVKTDGHQITNHNILKYGNDKLSVFKSLLKFEFNHTIWGKLYKSSIFKNNTYQTYEHLTNGEDGCLFYQIVDNVNKIVQINKPVYYYMQNMQSSTQVRLKENAIKSICITNKMILDITSKYPELNNELRRRITNVMCSLYIQGYDRDAKLNYYIEANDLSEYVTLLNIIRSCKFSILLSLVYKRTHLIIKKIHQ